jgi:membrane associated rhomboid family serine protease
MNLDFILWALLVSCAYRGSLQVGSRARRLHGAVLMAIAGAAALALAGVAVATPVALGSALCVLVLSPVLRSIGKYLARRESFAVADKLFATAAVLAPGGAADDERAGAKLLGQVNREGIDVAVKALLSVRRELKSDPNAVWSIDERIVLLFASAGRWQEALDHAMAHLPAEPPGGIPTVTPAQVELIAAEGRLMHFDSAIARFESIHQRTMAAPERVQMMLAPLLHRARLLLFAHAGMVNQVSGLLAELPKHVASTLQRHYVQAIAAMRSGDVDAGKRHVALARRNIKDSRQRSLLTQVEQMASELPLQLSVAHSEGLVSIGDLALPVSVRSPSDGRLITAPILVAMIVAGFLWHLSLGDASGDSASYVRAGALTVTHLDLGQWWRAATCVFVHIGPSHLVMNALALWILCRVAESVFGRVRTLALFCLGGVGGAVASYAVMTAGIAAGASGAAMAILGALVIEIATQRRRYPLHWRRGVTFMLLLVALAQFVADYALLGGVHWAHVSGWIIGMVMSPVFSPRESRGKFNKLQKVKQGLAVAVVTAAAGLLVWGVVSLATSNLNDWYAQQPSHRLVVKSTTITVPVSMQGDTQYVSDRDLDVSIRSSVARQSTLQVGLASWLAMEQAAATSQGLSLGFAPPFPIVDGWTFAVKAAIDNQGKATGRQLTVFAKSVGDDVIVGTLYSSPWFATHAQVSWLRWAQSIAPSENLPTP